MHEDIEVPQEQAEALTVFLSAAVRIALEDRGFDALLSLVKGSLRSIGPSARDAHLPPDSPEYERLALVFARDLWRVLPLPRNDFRPNPLPEPDRNAPCFCGSGQKYKRCCRALQDDLQFMPLTPQLLWPLIIEELPARQLRELVRTGRIPLVGIGTYANELAAQGKEREAVRILRPALRAPLRESGEDAAMAYTLLCDLYDELDQPEKKRELTYSIIDAAPRSPLRAEAYQRLATILMDSDLIAESWDAFTCAQQDNPGDPALSILEVNLLLAENRADEAKQRAQFWLKRLQRDNDAHTEELREFLRNVVANPDAAMVAAAATMDDGAAQWLPMWVDQIVNRPIARYSLAATTMPMPAVPFGASEAETIDATVHRLCAPPAIAAIEARWRTVFPLDKPFGTHEEAFDSEQAWSATHEPRWRDFLASEPAAADSLSILDDIVTALGALAQAEMPWFTRQVTQRLIERGCATVAATVMDAPQAKPVWLIPENRPALRMLARSVGIDTEFDNHERALQTERRLLELNPIDNHGMRAPLINAELIADRNSEALAIAERYPGDMHADVAYGGALALFRLQRKEQGEQILRKAMQYLPRVPKYLAADKVREPPVAVDHIKIGGDDQAWLYRLAMRAEWQRTPGALRWLEQTTRSVGPSN